MADATIEASFPDCDEPVWYLTISTWIGISFGARHHYGRLHQPHPGGTLTYPMTPEQERLYGPLDVERTLTAQAARDLSDGDQTLWREGDRTTRFDTRGDVIVAAIQQWRELPDRRGLKDAALHLGHPAVITDEPAVLDVLGAGA